MTLTDMYDAAILIDERKKKTGYN